MGRVSINFRTKCRAHLFLRVEFGRVEKIHTLKFTDVQNLGFITRGTAILVNLVTLNGFGGVTTYSLYVERSILSGFS